MQFEVDVDVLMLRIGTSDGFRGSFSLGAFGLESHEKSSGKEVSDPLTQLTYNEFYAKMAQGESCIFRWDNAHANHSAFMFDGSSKELTVEIDNEYYPTTIEIPVTPTVVAEMGKLLTYVGEDEE